MARTPLLRSLRQLASDYQRAQQLGTSLEEVREEQRQARESGVSRRQVLAGAAGLAATSLLPRRARAAKGPRIAIVGGGIAGLTSALTLADGGVASTVYEYSSQASDIGGRMHSNTSYWRDGQVSEWCGELIDTGHKTVQALAKRFNLNLADLSSGEPNGSEDTYYFFGKYYPKSQADIDFKPVHNALQGDVQAASYPTLYNYNTAGGRALDSMSIYDWIESRVPGGHTSPLGMLLDVAYNIEYGADTTQQSSLNLVYLLGYNASPGNFSIFGLSDERYHIVGGNQQLPQAIAQYLGTVGSSVQLGYQLLAVAMNADGTYSLTFNVGNTTKVVVADYVVLALPFAVLRTLDYRNAGFDALKNTAIQNLGRGHNGKLHLQFSSRYWYGPGPWPAGISNGNGYADTGFQNTWEVSRTQPGMSGILVDYTGGSVATAMKTKVPWATVATSSVQQDAATFLSQIEPVFPGITGAWNGLATSSLPFLAPNLNCSYSYWLVGQYQQFAGYEKARQGNVFFTGEHTSQDFQGFMEGGASEGIRAGNEVLNALGLHSAARPKSRREWLALGLRKA
jgi:monoamine oxidase